MPLWVSNTNSLYETLIVLNLHLLKCILCILVALPLKKLLCIQIFRERCFLWCFKWIRFWSLLSGWVKWWQKKGKQMDGKRMQLECWLLFVFSLLKTFILASFFHFKRVLQKRTLKENLSPRKSLELQVIDISSQKLLAFFIVCLMHTNLLDYLTA